MCPNSAMVCVLPHTQILQKSDFIAFSTVKPVCPSETAKALNYHYFVLFNFNCIFFLFVYESPRLQNNLFYPEKPLSVSHRPSIRAFKAKNIFAICKIYFKLLFKLCISIYRFFFYNATTNLQFKTSQKGTTFVLNCAGQNKICDPIRTGQCHLV